MVEAGTTVPPLAAGDFNPQPWFQLSSPGGSVLYGSRIVLEPILSVLPIMFLRPKFFLLKPA